MCSNLLNNLVESYVGSRSNRDAVKVDLSNKIVYDDPTVFRRLRLRIDQFDNDFVAKCGASFKAAKSGDIDIDTLVMLVEKASEKTPDD